MRAMTPFMGRETELQQLIEAFEALAADGKGRLAVIVGEAGIGKSRLVHEFLRAVGRKDMLALDGGAAPYSSGAGYRPGVNILRQYFNVGEADDVKILQEKVAGRLVALDGDSNTIGVPLLALMRALPTNHRFWGLPVNERRQRVFTALMWLAERMSADRPLVLAYEDLQWATSDTRDFLDAFVRQVPRSIFVLLTYRSEYDDRWLRDCERLELRLDGISPAATRKIMTDLLGPDDTLAELKDELPRRSGGNPLFIEEYVRSMVDSGELQGNPGAIGWVRIAAKPRFRPPFVRCSRRASIGWTVPIKQVLQTFAAVGEVATVRLLESVCAIPPDALRKVVSPAGDGWVAGRASRWQAACLRVQAFAHPGGGVRHAAAPAPPGASSADHDGAGR
jgi:predicted ATPase